MKGCARRLLLEHALNDEIASQLRVCDWRTYTWESFDGLEIEGLLALPRNYEGGALPLVVLVHGGPTGTWSSSFVQAGLVPALEDSYHTHRTGVRWSISLPRR